MHRYREFGLVSNEDETLRRAFRDGFKRAGLSHQQLLEALGWYRDHARPGTGEADLLEAFSEFAAQMNWPADQIDGVVEIYESIRDDGPAAVAEAAPPPDQDRATIARGDEALRRDPTRYWRDAELQDAVFEARERLEALAGTGPAAQSQGTDPARQRAREIEALLRDNSGAGQRRYWADPALREEYARALSGLHGDGNASQGEDASPAAPVSDAPAHVGTVPQSA
jgi:hypothetical protein